MAANFHLVSEQDQRSLLLEEHLKTIVPQTKDIAYLY